VPPNRSSEHQLCSTGTYCTLPKTLYHQATGRANMVALEGVFRVMFLRGEGSRAESQEFLQ
jgi:hypothetical protein